MMKVAFQVAARFGGTGLGYISCQAVQGIQDAGMLARVTCLGHEKTDIADAMIKDVRNAAALSRVLPRRLVNLLGLDTLLQQNYFGFVASRNLRGCDIVHGYTGQMFETIRAARRRNIRCVVDRPNAHVNFMRRALEAEYKKYDVPFAPYRASQVRRETEELAKCDAVVTCSDFARDTMLDEGVDAGKVHVVPYGVDVGLFHPEPKRDDVFRVVFAGLICLRKGVQYLLEAWERLGLDNETEHGKAELILQGHVLDDAAGVVDYYRSRCRFTVRPHTGNMAELNDLYNSASVCVFPSVEDGFGMVVTEAMACNRPVIVTEHMGAAEVVEDGVDGFVVPAARAAVIAEKLRHLHQHRDSSLGLDGRRRISGLTWDAYRSGLLSVYEKIGVPENDQATGIRHCALP